MTTASRANVPEFTMRDRLRKAREMTGMDQSQFAAAIGVSRATVSNYESSNHKPREIVVRAWSLATGVPVAWLKSGRATDHPTPPVDPSKRRGPEGITVMFSGLARALTPAAA